MEKVKNTRVNLHAFTLSLGGLLVVCKLMLFTEHHGTTWDHPTSLETLLGILCTEIGDLDRALSTKFTQLWAQSQKSMAGRILSLL